MIKDSSKCPFDTVIVWKLDRFASNRYDAAYYKNALKKNKVRVVSAIGYSRREAYGGNALRIRGILLR